MRKQIIFLCFFVCGVSLQGIAQSFSFVYIQGDKDISFYVKYADVMLPRYGKNYTVISKLAPGPMKIEILFERNEYDPVTFNIMIPDGGERSFMLNRKGGEFILYDLQQNFILEANNDISDDRLTEGKNLTSASTTSVQQQKQEVVLQEARKKKTLTKETDKGENQNWLGLPKRQKELSKVEKIRPEKSAPVIDKKPLLIPKQSRVEPASKDLQFLDITLPNSPQEESKPKVQQSKNVDNQPTEQVYVTNTDCPVAISDVEFESILNYLRQASDDEDRLSKLSRIDNACFTLQMTKSLVIQFESDAARYSVLKKIYPRIVNQHDFATLENLFDGGQYKEHFRQMIIGD